MKDVIDCMADGIASRVLRAKLERAVLQSILEVIEEEAEKARLTFGGNTYVQKPKTLQKAIYDLWMQQKTTNKYKVDIYKYISNCLNISHRTVEEHVAKFSKGYNPYADCL